MKIPEACLKQSIAIIGRTGSGKTFCAKGLCEHLLANQARVCIVDPLGVWWGLRSSVDGSKPAFPIVVFGGDHADVQLSEGMGAALAEALANQNLPAIVDVSEFSSAGRTRFMTSFLEHLYVENRSPLTLVFDEADMFAPQRPGKEQLTMLSRMEQICRRGRVRGFRPWLITQRPASLHKSVLSQANTLIALQLTAPQDRDALGDWIEGQADRVEGKRILAALPKLARGEGFVWAPHEGVLEQVKFPKITTYDSSRTPEDGETLPQVKLASVDLSHISEALLAQDEGPDADDPKVLRAEIKALEAELADVRAGGPGAAGNGPTLEDHRRALDGADIAGYHRGSAEGYALGRQAALAVLHTIDHALAQASGAVRTALEKGEAAVPVEVKPEPPRAPAPARGAPQPPARGSSKLGNSGKRRMLVALAQHRSGLTHAKLSILTGIARSGGTWRIYLKDLRDAGWIDGEDPVRITAAGMKELGPFEPLPTGHDLRQYWRGRLGGGGKRKILDAVIEAYPHAVAAERVSERSGIAMSGGTWRIYVSELRNLDLISGHRELRASPELFE